MPDKIRIRQGFTLVELLSVIAILAVLCAVLVPSYKNATKTGYLSRMLSSLGKPQATLVTASPWLSPHSTWEQAYQTIRNNLLQAGYSSFGLYLTQEQEGFFVITAPERIQANGLPALDRWNLARHLQPSGNLKEWLRAFFSSAPEGVYRIYVFAVSTEPPINTTQAANWIYLAQLAEAAGDFAHLPSGLSAKAIGEARLHCYVYLYERGQAETFPHPLNSTSFSVQEHLQKSNLENLLK